MRRGQGAFLWILISAMCVGTMPQAAHAGVISAAQYMSARERQSALERVEAALAREDVRRELERYGVAAETARERVAALSDAELCELAEGLDRLPAGGVLGTIGVVFIVLLILEFVGVIDIFNKI